MITPERASVQNWKKKKSNSCRDIKSNKPQKYIPVGVVFLQQPVKEIK